VVDGNGRIIYHSDTSRIGEDVWAHPVARRVLSGESGALRTNGLAGETMVVSFSPVPRTRWGLITEENWEMLIRSSRGYQRLLILLLVLAGAAPIIVITLGARRITQPITDLMDATQKVASGSFDQTITVSTGDELEMLAEQFNLMTHHIQDSYTTLERKVADRTKELAALNAIAASVNASLELKPILNQALDLLLNAMELEVGEIRLLEPERGELVVHAYRGLSEAFIQRTDRLPLIETLPGRVLLSGRLIVHPDIGGEHRRSWAAEDGVRAAAICPIQVEREQLGTLCVGTRIGPRPYTSNERELLRAVSDQLGIAIEKARMFQTEQRRAEQFKLINEVGQRITSILAVDELLAEMVRLVSESLGYYLVGIGLVEGSQIEIRAVGGQLEHIQDFQPVRFGIEADNIVSQAARTGEPILVPHLSVLGNVPYLPLLESQEVHSELAVPIRSKEDVIGVLHVQTVSRDAFDEKDLTVLQSLAHQAAIAIENARLYQKAQELAVIEERNRLARDLHDSVTQALYGVTLFGEAAGRLIDTGNFSLAAKHLQELQTTAQEALREMRLLIFELRPSTLDEDGLTAALQARLEAVEGRTGLETTFEVVGKEERLRPEIEEGLYRIAQEALNNALKHAHAQSVHLYLCQEKPKIVLEVSDDGVGFDPSATRQQGGFGLRGMEERAARIGSALKVESQPGAGTRVRVEVPQ
jgi:nitrate/nitrite-specific signal transduction histidine kinase